MSSFFKKLIYKPPDFIFWPIKKQKRKKYLRLPYILRVFATKEKIIAALFFPVVIARNKVTK